ncbi:MAG: ThiF family adenylyltransferase [Nanoarchaeota archaeon]|nr:ThiF family adenylyltransferase [Nanoarchaeota archaeon]
MDEIYNRNIGVWDEKFQKKLKQITIGIAGLGGSGGTLVEILARNGFGKFKIADPGYFDETNIQRQINATKYSLNKNKTKITEERIKSINETIEIDLYEKGINKNNISDFLKGCDFVHEVMDYSLPELKILFHQQARKNNLITTTSAIVGTGVSTIVFHPNKMTFEDFFEYSEDIDSWNIPPDKLVGYYPDYLDINSFLKRVSEGEIPTSADGAFLTGITVAAIYKRILMGKEIAYAPKILRVDFLDDNYYFGGIL